MHATVHIKQLVNILRCLPHTYNLLKTKVPNFPAIYSKLADNQALTNSLVMALNLDFRTLKDIDIRLVSDFYMGFEVLNRGPHVCIVHTFSP